MWFWPVNKMTELVSGMPGPQFGDESSLSARIRAGSRFKRFLCFVFIDVRQYRVALGIRLPKLKTTDLENVGASTSHNPMGLHGLLQR
jgi:hypothetical protein